MGKKNKNKKSRSREYSSSSSSSGSEGEVVWGESKPNDTKDNETNEWFNLFEKNCTQNTKTDTKAEDKREKQLIEQKVRQQRELNPFIKYDSEGNCIIDEPRHQKTWGDRTAPERQPERSAAPTAAMMSEKNAINAKLIKAELMGNQKLIKELKEKLKQLESGQNLSASNSGKDRDEDVDHYYAMEKTSNEESMSLKELYYREKKSTAEDENRRFVATTSKTSKYPEEEYEDTRKKNKKRRHEEPKTRYVRQENEDRHKCRQCLENIDKQLVLSVGEKTIISLTPFEPFVKGMSYILSRGHSNVSTISCDESCLEEINERKHQISKFFEKQKKSVIFMETYYKKRHSNRHLMIECIPIKSKYLTDAQIFFKKGIMESESEWAMNKQVIQIKDKPVNRMIPKGLSYFWVTFGPKNDGFGHVIENEDKFSPNFGKEIIGGLLDVEPNKWMRPKNQNYDQQFERVVKIKKDWNKEFEK